MTPASRSSNSSATSMSELESARAKDPAENPVGVPGFRAGEDARRGSRTSPKLLLLSLAPC